MRVAARGTPYGDVPAYGRAHADEGLLVYLEACEHGAYDVARELHGLRLAGWFDHASGVLIGRTPAPDAEKMTQHEAVADALGMLDVPVILDADIGHTQPFLAAGQRRLGARDVHRRRGRRDADVGLISGASGSCDRQSAGTRSAGPGTVWSSGCAVGAASSGPSSGSSVR